MKFTSSHKVTSSIKCFDQFNNPEGMSDFAYITDIISYLNDMNLQLQLK